MTANITDFKTNDLNTRLRGVVLYALMAMPAPGVSRYPIMEITEISVI
jgi:hypothetical protein